MEAYKSFVEDGVKHPDDIAPGGAVHEKFFEWQKQADMAAKDEHAKQLLNLEKTMFYVDAGFTDPGYLDEVMSWLEADLEEAEESEKPMPDVVAKIQAAIERVRGLLRDSKPPVEA